MNQVQEVDYEAARYGERAKRKRACAQAYASTGRRCCKCMRLIEVPPNEMFSGHPKKRNLPRRYRGLGRVDRGEVHESRYWAWYRWVIDCFNAMRGKQYDGVWGSTVNRWWIGWDCFPLHASCHQYNRNNLHSERNWITSKVKPELLNKNTWQARWELRIKWFCLKLLIKIGWVKGGSAEG